MAMAFLNRVVSVLVVWAVVVTIWMVGLSVKGRWNQCTARTSVEEKLTPSFLEVRDEPDTTAQKPTIVSTEAATTESVYQQRLAQYSSKIMHGPDSVGVSSAKHSLTTEENCTAVVLAYEPQTNALDKVINHYCRVPFLHSIYIMWNSVNETIPKALTIWEKKCRFVKVKFILPDTSEIINRYSYWKKIETDCVCFLDDDVIVSTHDMTLGYEVWQNFRYQFVGFQEASFYKNSNGSYTYRPFQRRRYVGLKYKKSTSSGNMVQIKNGTRILVVGNKTYILGKRKIRDNLSNGNSKEVQDGYSIMEGPSFIHKTYLEMYFDPVLVPVEAVQHVRDLNNCEDILLSIVVTKFMQDTSNGTLPGVLTMKPSFTIKHLRGEEKTEVRQSKTEEIMAERSKCLNSFSHLYGYLPLKPTNNIVTLV